MKYVCSAVVDGGEECVRDVLDGVGGFGGADDEYDVELRFERDGHGAHIGVGCLDQAASLAHVHCFEWIHEVSGPGLYLHEAYAVILEGYEVNLHTGHFGVFSGYGIALGEQVFACHLLAPQAESVMSGHGFLCVAWIVFVEHLVAVVLAFEVLVPFLVIRLVVGGLRYVLEDELILLAHTMVAVEGTVGDG